MKVLFINQILAHYRSDVLRILDSDPRLDCAFAAGTDSSGIDLIPEGILRRRRRVKNVRIGRANWQLGALFALLAERPRALIAEGDVSILSNWWLVPVARLFGVRTYFWTIGWRSKESGLKGAFRLMYYRLADGLLVYGERGRELGVSHGYPSGKIVVVGNSTSSRASSEELEPGFDAHMRRIEASGLSAVVAVARLTHLKRFDLLIRAAALANREGRPFQVVLAGEGPERESLVELARGEGVVLHVLGSIYSSRALASLYQQASVTVLPKAAGLTTIQSLAHGVPVVTDDDDDAQVPESAAVLAGVTGTIYASGSITEIESSIQDWIQSMAVRRQEIQAACREEVARFWTPEAHARRIAEALVADEAQS